VNWAVLADLAAELGAFGVAAIVLVSIVTGRLITKGHHNEIVDVLTKELDECHRTHDLERARHERDPE
jgi:hypothetical protein